MTDTAGQPIPEQGIISRGYAVVCAFLRAMDYTSFDYTIDRIGRLGREVQQLKEELHQIRDSGGMDAHSGAGAELED